VIVSPHARNFSQVAIWLAYFFREARQITGGDAYRLVRLVGLSDFCDLIKKRSNKKAVKVAVRKSKTNEDAVIARPAMTL